MCRDCGVSRIETDGRTLKVEFFGHRLLDKEPGPEPPVKAHPVSVATPVEVSRAVAGQDEPEEVHPLDLILHAPSFENMAPEEPEAK